MKEILSLSLVAERICGTINSLLGTEWLFGGILGVDIYIVGI